MSSESRDWQKVVVECEQILGCKDTAESATASNLPNLVRDLKTGLDRAEEAKKAADTDLRAVIDSIPGAVRVREGGGDENLYASLALSISKLLTRARRMEAALIRIKETSWHWNGKQWEPLWIRNGENWNDPDESPGDLAAAALGGDSLLAPAKLPVLQTAFALPIAAGDLVLTDDDYFGIVRDAHGPIAVFLANGLASEYDAEQLIRLPLKLSGSSAANFAEIMARPAALASAR